MDRKDFLRHVAIGAVALVGGGALLRLMAIKPGAADGGPRGAMAYGRTAYGGSRPDGGGRT